MQAGQRLVGLETVAENAMKLAVVRERVVAQQRGAMASEREVKLRAELHRQRAETQLQQLSPSVVE